MGNYDDMPIYVDRNKELFAKILIPAVVQGLKMSGNWRNTDELDVQEIARRLYAAMRDRWPQLNEKTAIREHEQIYRLTPFTFQMDSEPRQFVFMMLVPGLKAAFARAALPLIRKMRDGFVWKHLYRLWRYPFLWTSRLHTNLSRYGSRFETVSLPPPIYVEHFAMEQMGIVLPMRAYIPDDPQTVMIHIRGFYIPRLDQFHYEPLWDSFSFEDKVTDPHFYVQPDSLPSTLPPFKHQNFDLVLPELTKGLDAVLENFDTISPNVTSTDINLLPGTVGEGYSYDAEKRDESIFNDDKTLEHLDDSENDGLDPDPRPYNTDDDPTRPTGFYDG